MRIRAAGNVPFMIVAAAVVALAVVTAYASQSTPPSHRATKEDFARWKKELSNWGRWGKDDQLGALNLITPAKRKQAAALVTEGFSVSLARDAETVKAIDNPNPYELGDGRLAVSYHGTVHTHLDSLSIMRSDYEGANYNGYTGPQAPAVAKEGFDLRNSIYNIKIGIVTRGILVDIPRLKGVPYLEPGTPIYLEDLEAWEKRAGIKVSSGDALFVRVGTWPRRKAVGPWDRRRGGIEAGLHPSVIPWLKQRDIALLGSDGINMVAPSEIPGAVHDFAPRVLGVHVFDNCDLDALSDATASRRRWEFMLTAAPLPLRGATGSPINPIATF